MKLAEAGVRRTIQGVTNDDARERIRQLDLMELQRYLRQRRYFEKEIGEAEDVLNDPDFAEHHAGAKRFVEAATKALGICNELIELKIHTLGLREHRAELQERLEALGSRLN
ncbi:hypothetical protein [Bradyrhizobium diazoefficiens]|nr:hypothetical protein XF15B_58950 [Bradyrhizobium diazoefficiens]